MTPNQSKSFSSTDRTERTETHTIVVEFPCGKSPTYHARMEVLGGQVTGVAFDGDRLEVADALLDALQLVMSYPDIREYVGSIVSEQADAAIAKATA